MQGGAVNYGSNLPILVAMSSSEAEYIAAAVACMLASHIRMLIYDLKFLGESTYDCINLKFEPDTIIIDNEAVITMAKCNKDTAGNRPVARRYHYVCQGSSLKEHEFKWIGIKYQLADPMTKPSTLADFGKLWSYQLSEDDQELKD